MSDRILQRYVARIGMATDPETALPAESEGDDAESFGCFGWVRGVRDRAICLELRKKTGKVLAIPYAYISRMEFEPSGVIRLGCGGESITITGRNLNGEVREQVRLFQGLTRHRVPWIQEADRAVTMQAEKNSVVVESVEW
jgi:hypothetical protein